MKVTLAERTNLWRFILGWIMPGMREPSGFEQKKPEIPHAPIKPKKEGTIHFI
jgi:hypothetical protein